jgi:hypothetical protein
MYKKLIMLLFLVAFTSFAYAEESVSYKGHLTLMYQGVPNTFKNLPTFEDFPAEKVSAGKVAKDIDWKSHKSAWSFRTRLRKALRTGVNFNGHYAVATFGCGSSCQINFIIDVNNGKVVGEFTTTQGSAYRKDSSLIILELFRDGADWTEEYGMVTEVSFMKF